MFAHFLARLAYKFATSANMTPKIFVTNFLQIFFDMGILM
jgi:hypothetical protein